MTAKLYEALGAAQARCKAVGKDAVNEHHRYKYASAEAIFSEAKSALEGTGLSVLPTGQRIEMREAVPGPLSRREREEGFKADPQAKIPCLYLVRSFELVHSSGESKALHVEWPIVLEAGRPLDKAVAGAETSSLAYLYRDLLAMPRVDDADDMNSNARDRASGKCRRREEQEDEFDPSIQAANELFDIVSKKVAEVMVFDQKNATRALDSAKTAVQGFDTNRLCSIVVKLDGLLDKQRQHPQSAAGGPKTHPPTSPTSVPPAAAGCDARLPGESTQAAVRRGGAEATKGPSGPVGLPGSVAAALGVEPGDPLGPDEDATPIADPRTGELKGFVTSRDDPASLPKAEPSKASSPVVEASEKAGEAPSSKPEPPAGHGLEPKLNREDVLARIGGFQGGHADAILAVPPHDVVPAGLASAVFNLLSQRGYKPGAVSKALKRVGAVKSDGSLTGLQIRAVLASLPVGKVEA